MPGHSAKERLILRLLKGGPMYGLDMIKQSDGVLKRGTIYVTLSRMEDEGLVRSFLVEAPPPVVPRRQYKLTSFGQTVAKTAEHSLGCWPSKCPWCGLDRCENNEPPHCWWDHDGECSDCGHHPFDASEEALRAAAGLHPHALKPRTE